MSDDAANVILGGDWQLPTKEMWLKLIENTNTQWKWNAQDKFNSGHIITSKSDNTKSFFLPAAGNVYSNSIVNATSNGSYWSGTADSKTGTPYLYIDGQGLKMTAIASRYYGYTVRPVRLVEVEE